MTTQTPEEAFQEAAATAWAGFGALLGLCSKVVMDLYETVAEWAVQEQEYVGVSQTKVFVHVDEATQLFARLRPVTALKSKPLPDEQVTVTPATLPAMKAGEICAVVVGVTVPDPAPAYLGTLVDAAGKVVEKDVYISVMA